MLFNEANKTESGKDKYLDYSLKDWQKHFEGIFKEKNRYYSIYFILARLSEEIGELVEPINNLNKELLQYQIADIFVWICCLASKLNLSIEDIMIRKYHERPPMPLKAKDTLESYFDIISKPKSIRNWQNRIENLYGEINTLISPQSMTIYLFKDLGDLAKAIRRHQKTLIESKIASLMAWTLAIGSKFDINLDVVIAQKYNTCPVCKHKPCVCRQIRVFFVIHNNKSPEVEIVKKITSKLDLEMVAFEISSEENNLLLLRIKELLDQVDSIIFILEKVTQSIRLTIPLAISQMPQTHILVAFKSREPEYKTFFMDTMLNTGIKENRIVEYSDELEFAEIIEKFIKKLIFSNSITK